MLLGLYAVYSASRLLADDSLDPAVDRAGRLLDLEQASHLDLEHPLNDLFTRFDWLGVFSSYWYATAHYVVTAVVLVWLYRQGADRYRPARRALVLATLLGLACYLVVPTAPPRFIEGYVDVLQLHSTAGWWGGDASAPRGLGQMTNELAAFPSLHAGWALWVALVLQVVATVRWAKVAGWTHAVVTAVVVVGTGNHWLLDVVAGWGVVVVAWVCVALARGMVGQSAPREAVVSGLCRNP
ncbi:phosphatase PAP2 family protein [Nocardioides sp. SYSU D00038]|uniref:phosphatase PAP2 family protein n=1 Tax=Nocardioides sp. SYSU D00038 TaxID=2812554 RepID=UPI00196866E6|nr:phosphatase PAP2 family protein [Nocardioides sp. SYSU D00038]